MAATLRGQLVGFACSRRPERRPGGEQLREKHRFTCGSKPSRAAHPLNSRGRKRGRTLGDHVHLVFRGLTGELLFRQARLANLGPIWLRTRPGTGEIHSGVVANEGRVRCLAVVQQQGTAKGRELCR